MAQFAIIIPTYNEAENLPILLNRIFETLEQHRLDAEILIVDDDSKDGTAELARKLGNGKKLSVIVRKNERGLATAVLEGFRQAKSDLLLVCDADLSHPVEKIPELLAAISSGEAEMAIGSRYVEGGKIIGWPFNRKLASRFAAKLSSPLTPVKDSMSGFFAVKRDVFERGSLQPIGYKLALEILVRCKVNQVKEVPITFTERQYGKSKYGSREIINYLKHLIRLNDFLRPAWMEFFRFCVVGLLSFLIDLGLFSLAFEIFGWDHKIAQAFSFVGAATNNFLLNKNWTFRGPQHGKTSVQYLLFLAFATLSLSIRTVFFWLLTDQWKIPVYLAFVLGIGVTIMINFSANRWIVFRRRES